MGASEDKVEQTGNLYDTYKKQLELWGPVNRQLKQHGLRHVLLSDPNQMLQSNDVIGFSTADSDSLRDNLVVLMKDGDRRQTLIQDLILTNNQLRNDLETRGEPSRSDNEERVNLLTTQLSDTKSKVQELEVQLEQQREMCEEENERDNNTKLAAQSRARQLEKRCELQEEELERLRSKVSRLDTERQQRDKRVSEIFQELRRGRSKTAQSAADKRVMDVIDMYETEISELKEKLGKQRKSAQNNNCNDESLDSEDGSVQSERTHRYKDLIKSFNNDLKHSERELKRLREKNDLLQLELQARPHIEDYNKSKLKIRQLEKVLQEHSVGIYGKDAFSKRIYSTKKEDIDFLPLVHCRKYLTTVCESLELNDLDELESRLDYQKTAVDGFPKLEDLVVQIADVVEPSLARNHKSNKHRVWCSKHWKNIITRLETWRQNIKQLPEMGSVVGRLLQQFDKPQDTLPAKPSMNQVIEAVESIISQIPPTNSQPIENEKISHSVLLSMVKHFQHLFDVPNMAGMYPRMNEVYTRYNEMKNVHRTLAELLDLGDNYKGSDLVDAVGRVCQSYTSSTYTQLKQLLQEDDLDSVIERLDEHRRFMPLFRDVIDHLMDILDVERIDQVVPSVRAIKLMIS